MLLFNEFVTSSCSVIMSPYEEKSDIVDERAEEVELAHTKAQKTQSRLLTARSGNGSAGFRSLSIP